MTTQTHNPANLPGGADRWERVRSGLSQEGDYAVYTFGSVEPCGIPKPIVSYWENPATGVPLHIYRLKTTLEATALPFSEKLHGLQDEEYCAAYWKQRAKKAEADNAELCALFDLQQTRMGEATKAWRIATGNHDVMPDLGKLLAWMLERMDEQQVLCEQQSAATIRAEEELKELRSVNRYQRGHSDGYKEATEKLQVEIDQLKAQLNAALIRGDDALEKEHQMEKRLLWASVQDMEKLKEQLDICMKFMQRISTMHLYCAQCESVADEATEIKRRRQNE